MTSREIIFVTDTLAGGVPVAVVLLILRRQQIDPFLTALYAVR